ncbi:DNA repair protein RecO [Flavobacteriaceae bacterium F08102]|nr:DNA repair protein RecO [Flavobacteriaceae bacterium F08102]
MLHTHKAIVLSSLKYGEADLIVKCYTEIGLKSYFLKGILKQKKGRISASYFLPLSQLEITANYPSQKQLFYIKDVRVAYPYNRIATDIKKQTIVLFLSEVLTHALKEEESNPSLFSFIETALQWLDTHERTSNFHLLFLMNLTRHLGFYPEFTPNRRYFDLLEGKFTDHFVSKHYISGELLGYFTSILGTNFDALESINLNKKSRHKLLEILIEYFELHLSGFKKPKSLAVLKTIFN